MVSNALRYRHDKRTPHIRIWSEKKDDMARIYIKDNGIGFDEKYKNRIFNILNGCTDATNMRSRYRPCNC
ncbi:hypothetical protein IPM65_01205 [Candidatus Roizmanbacteria bacterium]|nr:MAG: hypothetical protein IPM65_01205 [Candidatus Roizmanbacteria bacterium]